MDEQDDAALLEEMKSGGGGRSLLPSVAGVCAILPFVFRFELNGLMVLSLALGSVGLLAALAELVRSSRRRNLKSALLAGMAALACGYHITSSGVLDFTLHAESAARELLVEEGVDVLTLQESDSSGTFEFTGYQGARYCEGNVTVARGNTSLFKNCGALAPESVLRTRCESEQGEDCFRLAERLRAGEGGDESAFPFFERSCSFGVPEGCYMAGLLLRIDGAFRPDDAAGATLWERGCELGMSRSCGAYAEAFRDGTGRSRDFARAAEFFRRGCDGGDGASCSNYGSLHLDGRGVEANPRRSAELYRRGCELGSALGCRLDAENRLLGRGVEPGGESALADVRRLCDEGATRLCVNGGMVLHEGSHGIERSRERALWFFQKSCELGDAVGCRDLGLYHQQGMGGLTADAEAANPFFRRGCDLGDVQACRSIPR